MTILTIEAKKFKLDEELYEKFCVNCYNASRDKDFYTREVRMANNSFKLSLGGELLCWIFSNRVVFGRRVGNVLFQLRIL